MDFKTNIPIYLQVIDDIKHNIALGKIRPGEGLPSTRELAVLYQINPNTAVRVYNMLEAEGICYTKRGLGSFVTDDAEKCGSVREELISKYTAEFVSCMRKLGIGKEEVKTYIEKYMSEEEE